MAYLRLSNSRPLVRANARRGGSPDCIGARLSHPACAALGHPRVDPPPGFPPGHPFKAGWGGRRAGVLWPPIGPGCTPSSSAQPGPWGVRFSVAILPAFGSLMSIAEQLADRSYEVRGFILKRRGFCRFPGHPLFLGQRGTPHPVSLHPGEGILETAAMTRRRPGQ